ncbi:hypothetical protein FKM82_026134 [Ascaphus truei]
MSMSEEMVEDGAIEWGSGLTAAMQVTRDDGYKKEGEEISEETLLFWRGIADVGLMDEVISNIQSEMEDLLGGVQQRAGQIPFQVSGESSVAEVSDTLVPY